MRAALIGNYGVGNWGDEALKEYFLSRFPEVEWVVLSAAPTDGKQWTEVPRLPFGLRSLFRGGWRTTLRALRECDVVVFGGGSLFTDVESIKAPLLWGWHALVARLLKKPILLAFQGIGPFRFGLSRWIAHRVVKAATFVSTRDEESVKRLPKNTKCIQSFDPIVNEFIGRNVERSENVLVIIPRNNSRNQLRHLMHLAIEENGFAKVAILSLQPDEEFGICRSLQTMVSLPSHVHVIESMAQLEERIAGVRLVISERYHGALAAFVLGVPVRICSQHKGDKLDGLARLIENGTSSKALQQRAREGEAALRAALQSIAS